jgi:hypothetical protein
LLARCRDIRIGYQKAKKANRTEKVKENSRYIHLVIIGQAVWQLKRQKNKTKQTEALWFLITNTYRIRKTVFDDLLSLMYLMQ